MPGKLGGIGHGFFRARFTMKALYSSQAGKWLELIVKIVTGHRKLEHYPSHTRSVNGDL